VYKIKRQYTEGDIPVHASFLSICSGLHDVGQQNVNILQHLQSDRRQTNVQTTRLSRGYNKCNTQIRWVWWYFDMVKMT